MMPWLTINLVVLAFELFAWLLDIFVGTSRLKLQTIFSFAMSVVNYWFVGCVRNVFQRAIDINAERELRLWTI